MDDLVTLKKGRGIVKARLTRFKNFCDKARPEQLDQYKFRLNNFQSCLSEFENIQNKIELLEDSVENNVEREKFEDQYFALLTEANSFVEKFEPRQSNGATFTLSDPITTIKLPPINLPSFSGDYESWPAFSDSFKSVIDENHSLSPVQKFIYLRSTLKGEAAQFLHSLEASAENYKVAWELLQNRYQNKRYLINKHVKAIFGQNKVIKESASGLRDLINNTQKHIRALKALGQPTDSWDILIIHLLTNNLNSQTHSERESHLGNDQIPNLEELINFLQNKCQVLDAMEARGPKQQLQITNKDQVKFRTPVKEHTSYKHVSSNSVKKCSLCDNSHPIFYCDRFKKLCVSDREKEVRRLGLCYNCLNSSTHTVNKCTSRSCSYCGKRHNSLLHYDKKQPTGSEQEVHNSNVKSFQTVTSAYNNTLRDNMASVILSTAVIKVIDQHGIPQLCRAMLDSCSQSNFITEKLVNKLGLKTSRCLSEVSGIGQSVTKTTRSAQCVIQSRLNSFSINLNCVVLPVITQNLPIQQFSTSNLNIPSNIQLADPHFNISSGIDMLIGAELFFDLLSVGKFKPSNLAPTFQNTVFGWIVAGKLNINVNSNLPTVCNLASLDNIDSNLQRFWTIEEISSEKKYSGCDKLCEARYSESTKRTGSGRYCVQLPLKLDVNMLGESRDIALHRFQLLERRLSKDPDLYYQYRNFMKEYEQLGHMEQITLEEAQSSKSYFIPHHPVIKEESTTTKVRVVFDASSKTSSGRSLNDILISGPTVQSDLISIITRFRTHNYVMVGDIEKMYRQVLIDPNQCNLQLILWRDNSEEPIRVYRLLTVTYGIASAPYLATRTLKQLAIDETKHFPTAAKVVIEDFYVDDLMTGAATLAEALQLQKELIKLTEKGGFHLRKWSSNHPALLSHLPEDEVEQQCFSVDEDPMRKTLGLMWNPKDDTFQFSIKRLVKSKDKLTKRSILAAIGRIFDPLGLLGLVIVTAKLIMQKLWCCKVGWDDDVPSDIACKWNQFQESLSILSTLKIPRAIVNNKDLSKLKIHGFSDASESAYGAFIYLKSLDHVGNISVQLITSKSRVAPLKTVSLPRLELCGALLLCELTNTVVSALHLNINSVSYYTDSTIVLAWINAESSHWTTFVANRVSKIQELSDISSWKFIKGEKNPADYLSRGLQPFGLPGATLFWNGPQMLCDTNKDDDIPYISTELIPEIRQQKISCLISTADESVINLNVFSSFTKAIRTFAYVLRFIVNTRTPNNRVNGPLTTSELKNSEMN